MEHLNESNSHQQNEACEKADKKKLGLAFDIALAILLALSALGMAWGTWMSQLHGSNEAQNYATSAALRAEGSVLTNVATLQLSSALTAWNDIVSLEYEREAYMAAGETAAAQVCSDEIDYIILLLADEETESTIRDALAQDPIPNPFSDEVIQSYYDEADAKLAEAEEAITAGNTDNLLSDAFAFVNVLYSIVLFMLAFIGMNKSEIIRRILIVASLVVFIVATIYMVALPLPTGFDFGNYLQFLVSSGN